MLLCVAVGAVEDAEELTTGFLVVVVLCVLTIDLSVPAFAVVWALAIPAVIKNATAGRMYFFINKFLV